MQLSFAGQRLSVIGTVVVWLLVVGSQVSEAQRRGGGGARGGGARAGGDMRTSGGTGGGARSSTGGARMSSGGGNRVSGDGGAARTSVNRDFNNATFNRTPTNTTTNANRNVNVSNGEVANRSNRATNVNRTNINNANVNNINVNNGYGGNYHLDYDVDQGWGHPVAAGAAFGAAAAVTSAAIGSVVYSLPPSCTVTVVNGISYQSCGGVWYEPQFSGTSVEYIVVAAPK